MANEEAKMALEKGDAVMFSEDVSSLFGSFVSKGTEGTVTGKVGWPSREYEVTLENGTKVKVEEGKIRKIGGKSSWWR
jgi:hypothetical protein